MLYNINLTKKKNKSINAFIDLTGMKQIKGVKFDLHIQNIIDKLNIIMSSASCVHFTIIIICTIMYFPFKQ